MTRVALLILMLTALPASADEIAISRFGSDGLKGWESKSFKGTTDYTIVQEEGRPVLKAYAKGAASGLTKKLHSGLLAIVISSGTGRLKTPWQVAMKRPGRGMTTLQECM
jgi:hypothetical protein